MIWTDESSFENGKNSAVVKVWRQTHEKYIEECLVPSFKSGKTSMMIWGAIRSENKSELLFLGDQDRRGPGFVSFVYESPLARLYELECGLILIEDGAPVHRSSIAKEWRIEKGLEVLDWPAQSPDLNPIENLWMIMKRRVQAERSRVGRFSTMEDHKACLQKVWDEFQPKEDRKSTRLNSSHSGESRMPSSA